MCRINTADSGPPQAAEGARSWKVPRGLEQRQRQRQVGPEDHGCTLTRSLHTGQADRSTSARLSWGGGCLGAGLRPSPAQGDGNTGSPHTGLCREETNAGRRVWTFPPLWELLVLRSSALGLSPKKRFWGLRRGNDCPNFSVPRPALSGSRHPGIPCPSRESSPAGPLGFCMWPHGTQFPLKGYVAKGGQALPGCCPSDRS